MQNSKDTNQNMLVERDNPVLRKVALPVPLSEIGSKKIKEIVNKMKSALHQEDDGVAIAAPQIGEVLRIFIVNGETLTTLNKSKKGADNKEIIPDMIFINPEIVKISKKKKRSEEGCLSLRWLYGQVERSDKATVRAYDETARKFTIGASGLLAQIFQHEIDHLNGILFIDKAINIEDSPPEKQK